MSTDTTLIGSKVSFRSLSNGGCYRIRVRNDPSILFNESVIALIARRNNPNENRIRLLWPRPFGWTELVKRAVVWGWRSQLSATDETTDYRELFEGRIGNKREGRLELVVQRLPAELRLLRQCKPISKI